MGGSAEQDATYREIGYILFWPILFMMCVACLFYNQDPKPLFRILGIRKDGKSLFAKDDEESVDTESTKKEGEES